MRAANEFWEREECKPLIGKKKFRSRRRWEGMVNHVRSLHDGRQLTWYSTIKGFFFLNTQSIIPRHYTASSYSPLSITAIYWFRSTDETSKIRLWEPCKVLHLHGPASGPIRTETQQYWILHIDVLHICNHTFLQSRDPTSRRPPRPPSFFRR